jgi:hypothetical protein
MLDADVAKFIKSKLHFANRYGREPTCVIIGKRRWDRITRNAKRNGYTQFSPSSDKPTFMGLPVIVDHNEHERLEASQ